MFGDSCDAFMAMRLLYRIVTLSITAVLEEHYIALRDITLHQIKVSCYNVCSINYVAKTTRAPRVEPMTRTRLYCPTLNYTTPCYTRLDYTIV